MEFQEAICTQLRTIEKENKVRIIFASDSGSRSFGWSRSDSDFDIHFIYTRDLSWYLTIQDERNNSNKAMSVEKVMFIKGTKIEVNCIGWDVKHAMSMISKSNFAIVFALTSPLIFITNDTMKGLIQLFEKLHTRSMLILTICNTIKGNIIKHVLKNKSVKLKIYIYLIHHVFYIKQVTQLQSAFPPQEMKSLISGKALQYYNYLLLCRSKGLDAVPRLYNLEALLLVVMRNSQNWAKRLWKTRNEVYMSQEFLNTLDEYLFYLVTKI